jgi:hypothetical protein
LFLAVAGKIRQLSDLYGPDAVFETNNARFVGPDGVFGFFTQTKDVLLGTDFLPARHHLSSVYLDPRPDVGASTYACFQFVAAHGLDNWGTHRDEVVPIDESWRFTRRRFGRDWSKCGSKTGSSIWTFTSPGLRVLQR